jgi:uncharacterized membrane protein (UPF0127 family)
MARLITRSLPLLVALLLALAGVALVAVSIWPAARAGGDLGAPPPDAPMVRFPQANTFALVELARTDAERARGLMERTQLDDGAGMLFVFPADTNGPFWMKNTLIPLSIAFIRADGVIVDIQDMQPQDETLHYPAAPYRYALEVPQGWFGRVGVTVGQRVELPEGV